MTRDNIIDFVKLLISVAVSFICFWTIADMYCTFTGMNKSKAFDHAEYLASTLKDQPDVISCKDNGDCFMVFFDKTSVQLKCPTITNTTVNCKIISKVKLND